MKDGRFEKFVKDRLYSAESNFDTEPFWNSLEENLVSQDSDSTNNQWLYGLLTLLLLTVSFYAYLSSPQDIQPIELQEHQAEVFADASIHDQFTDDDILNQSENSNLEEESKSTLTEVAQNTTRPQANLARNSTFKDRVNGDVRLSNETDVSRTNNNSYADQNVAEVDSPIEKQPKVRSQQMKIASLPLVGHEVISAFVLPTVELERNEVSQGGKATNPWAFKLGLEGGFSPGYQKVVIGRNLKDVQENRMSLRSYMNATAGLNAVLLTPTIFHFEAGLRYNYQRESVDHKEIRRVVDFASGGTSQAGKDKDSLTYSGRSIKILSSRRDNVVQHINAHSIEFPVGVGFSFEKHRWKWGASAGILAQTLFLAQGHKMIRQGNAEISYKDRVWTKNSNFDIGFYGHGHLGFSINNSCEIWLRAYAQQYPDAYANDAFDVDFSYIQTGLRIGASWNIL